MTEKEWLDIFSENLREIAEEFLDNNNVTNDSTWSSNETSNFSELETNKKNSMEFQKVMDNAAKKYDSYLDRNNVFVKIVLFCILAFVILGCLYYAILWFGNN